MIKRIGKLLLACSVMLSCIPSYAVMAADNDLTITVNNGSIQYSEGLKYKTNAKVQISSGYGNGLALETYSESVGQKGETIKIPNQTNSYIAVDVIDDLYANSTLNKYIEVEYDDAKHDSKAWICVEYVNAKGKRVYSEKAGVRNTGAKTATYTFCLDDARFDNSLDGYDFKLTNYLGDGSFKYSTSPFYIKSISVKTDNTVSPIDIDVTTKNKGNIFYTDDVTAFEVTYQNVLAEDVDFRVSYRIDNITTGTAVTVSEHFMDYTATAGQTMEEKIEPDVEDYGVYKLIISLSGTCSEGTINTSSETDFSVCVLNDTPNMHFGTLSREALGDLMLNAGIGTARDGYLIPYEKGYNYKFGQGWLPSLKNSEIYGIERIGSIMYSDGYSLPDPETQYKNMKNTALQFINTSRGLFDKISIGNEPELMNWVGDTSVSAKTTEDYRLLGERYGYMASAVAEAFRESGINAKLGAFETHLAHNVHGNTGWTREGMEAFYTAALEVMKAKGVLTEFDAYVFHGYLGNEDAEAVYDEDLAFAKGILDGYNYGNGTYEMWSTEGGFSTSTTRWYSNVIYGDEHEKANRIAKTYITMMGNDPSGVYLFYDFINDGDVNSEPEANFGMINASTRTKGTPYSAKQTYLAVAALNKLTGGMDTTEKLSLSEKDCYGYKFTNGTNSVYAYWWDNKPSNGKEFNEPITPDSAQHTVTPTVDLTNAHLYDFYGNELDKASFVADGKLIVTNDVIYVYTGDELKHSDKVIKSDIVNISGTIATGNADKNVSLIVVDEGTNFSSLPVGIKYVAQTTTDENGAYSFTAYMGENTNNLEAYIYTEENDDMRKLLFKSEGEDYSIVLKDGIFCVDEMSLDMLDMSNLKLRVRFSDKSENIENFRAYAVFYKAGMLSGMLAGEGDYEKGGDKLWMFGSDENDVFEYDTIKIMLWDSKMIPLVDAEVIYKALTE